MPRGYGGTAILWRKDIDTIVTPLIYILGIHFDCWENLYKEDRQR
jgi:hypothetical protein